MPRQTQFPLFSPSFSLSPSCPTGVGNLRGRETLGGPRMHLPWGRAQRGANICPRAHIWERRNAFSFSTGNSPKSQVAPTAEPWTRVPRPLSAPGLPATELISLTAVGPLRRPPLPHLPSPDPQGLRAESRSGWEGIQPERRVLLPPHSPPRSPGCWSLRSSGACIVQAPFHLASPALLV